MRLRRLLAGASAAVAVAVPLAACTVPTPPTVPQGYAVTVNANNSATIRWSPPIGSTVTSYRVSRDGSDTYGAGPYGTTLPASARSFTFNFLKPFARYRFALEAVNSAGHSVKLVVNAVQAPKITQVSVDADNAVNPLETAVCVTGASAATGEAGGNCGRVNVSFLATGNLPVPTPTTAYFWTGSGRMTRLFGCVDPDGEYTNVLTVNSVQSVPQQATYLLGNGLNGTQSSRVTLSNYIFQLPAFSCPDDSYKASGGTRWGQVTLTLRSGKPFPGFGFQVVPNSVVVGSIYAPDQVYEAPEFP